MVDVERDRHGYGIVAPHPRNVSKSAVRALDVLKFFVECPGPARGAQIADALGIARSSADQLLKTMVNSAYLLCDERTKLYRPAPRTAAFAGQLAQLYPEHGRLHALIESIHRNLPNMTVALTTRSRSGMQVIDYFVPDVRRERIQPGLKVPLAGSVSGLAFLASRPDREISSIVDRGRLCGPRGLLTANELFARVRTVREQGFSCGIAGPLRALGVAIDRDFVSAPVVLGIGAPPEQVAGREQEYAEMLRSEIAAA